MRPLRLILLAALSPAVLAAQPTADAARPSPLPDGTAAYALPFGSGGHRIELLISGAAEAGAPVEAALVEAPAGFAFRAATAPVRDGVAVFGFDVGEGAAVGEAQAARFEVRAGGRVVGEHAVRLVVEAPDAVALLGAYPNPFSSGTTIRFTLPTASDVRLRVYDMLGREVARLVEGARPAGPHEVAWRAGAIGSGVYVVRLETRSARGATAVQQGTVLLAR